MLAKKACRRCQTSKLKCDKALPSCNRCERSLSACIYSAPDSSLRIRDQTDKAERHAVSAWRARATDGTAAWAKVESRACVLQRPMTTDVEDLARHRFVYDFSEGQGGLSALSFFGELQKIGTLTEGEQRDAGGLEAAFMAASLANFHNRHRDSRVESLATPILSKALAVLRNSLQSSSNAIPRNLILMAILLGLHQNISPNEHLIGSWVHHFRGSVNLLQAAARSGLDEATYSRISSLLEKQALCISLGAGISFPLPAVMYDSLASRSDLRSRTLTLAAQAADYCALVKRQQSIKSHHGLQNVERWHSINNEFDRLEVALAIVIPFSSETASADSFPEWYGVISNAPGGPSTIHSYRDIDSAAVWNTYRMARINFCTVTLDRGPFHVATHSTTEEICLEKTSLRAKSSDLVEDLCASVFYCLSNRSDGSRPILSFEDIAGARAYTLISPLAVARERTRVVASTGGSSDRLDWIDHVMKIMQEKLGVSEAWCWKEGDEAAGRAQIEQQLCFDRQ